MPLAGRGNGQSNLGSGLNRNPHGSEPSNMYEGRSVVAMTPLQQSPVRRQVADVSLLLPYFDLGVFLRNPDVEYSQNPESEENMEESKEGSSRSGEIPPATVASSSAMRSLAEKEFASPVVPSMAMPVQPSSNR